MYIFVHPLLFFFLLYACSVALEDRFDRKGTEQSCFLKSEKVIDISADVLYHNMVLNTILRSERKHGGAFEGIDIIL